MLNGKLTMAFTRKQNKKQPKELNEKQNVALLWKQT